MTLSNGQGLQPVQAALPGVGLRPAARPSARSALHWTGAGYAAFLAAVVLALYLPAIGFGLVWDDPRWYQGLTAQTRIFASPSPPTLQFYRPLAVLFGRLAIAPNGVVNAPLAHAVQIGAHLLSTVALVPVLRGFRLSAIHARLAALCFAVYPLSYFGVAWQQNQQPLMLLWLLVAVMAAHRYGAQRARRYLALSVAAYSAALLFQEGAVPFVGLFFWLAWQNRDAGAPLRQAGWALPHLAAVGVYVLIWVNLPIQRAVTGAGFETVVLAYLVQGLVFPVAHLLTRFVVGWPAAVLLALFAAVWVLLAMGLWKRQAGSSLILGWAWAALGILPLWAGLSWGYAELGARLLYPAAAGMAVVWGGWMALGLTGTGWRRVVGAGAWLAILGVSALQWWQFQALFQVGTDHLAQAVALLSDAPVDHHLFVNFPDRLELRARPYPLGFWGLVLAPVVQDLSDYAVAATGHSAVDRSLAVFEAGVGGREEGPYRVALRGEGAAPADLWAAALWADTVYLTDYDPSGRLTLRPVGAVQPVPAGVNPLARLSGGTDLLEAELVDVPGQPPRLRLLWHSRLPQTLDTTIFVHLWRAGVFEAGADGDSLGGLLPASAWQPEGAVLDLRMLPDLSAAPGEYEVRVGLYRRWDGVRLPAYSPDGQRLPADAIPVATLRVP